MNCGNYDQSMFALFLLAALGFSRPSIKRSKVRRATNDVDCQLCEFAVNYVEGLLQDQKTIDEITLEVEKLCQYVEPEVVDICNAIVDEHVPQIIAYVNDKLSSNDVCKLIGICA